MISTHIRTEGLHVKTTIIHLFLPPSWRHAHAHFGFAHRQQPLRWLKPFLQHWYVKLYDLIAPHTLKWINSVIKLGHFVWNIIRWRPSQKRRAAGHNRQHVISRRLRVLPTCPEWLRLSPGLPSPAEAGLWQLTQGSRYGSHHARSLEASWWIGNKNCQILRRAHSKLCYM